MRYIVTIPSHKWRMETVKEQKPSYWESKHIDKLPIKWKKALSDKVIKVGRKLYLSDNLGNLFIKNPKSMGKPKYWVLNGQEMYSGNLHKRSRASLANKYHQWFKPYIEAQIPRPIEIGEYQFLRITCIVEEVKRPQMPDPSNLWPWIKWFEDSLQELGLLKDDARAYVKDTGRIIVKEALEGEEKISFLIEVVDGEDEEYKRIESLLNG
jgi:hypothetical protein